ncbi:MAG: DUF1934 domain-containing protein [Lachnospiraceae bacterium]|nr:DUF1934 domain-containing protein [Lachnospiraceae bacterium]
MSQEVKIKIRGLHGPGEEPVEVVSVGQMYEKDGYMCIAYDEVVSEEENGLVQVGKNLLKIRDDQVEVIKKGPSESHMVFVPERTTVTYYSTPVGELEVGIHTDHIEKNNYANGFDLRLQYELEMNQTFISRCSVTIAVEQ